MIEKLSNAYAPSGREEGVRNLISEELLDFYNEINVDNLGNLIIHKPGKKKKIAITAPMDEVGFIITHIKNDNLVISSSIGTVNKNTLQGIVARDDNNNLYISEICDNLSIINKKVKDLKFTAMTECKVDKLNNYLLSKTLIYDTKFRKTEKYYTGKALERSVSCDLLCNLARNLTDSLYEYYFIFSAYNYCDNKGAYTATYGLEIDELYNICGVSAEESIKLSGGPVIILRDGMMIASQKLADKFEKYENKQLLVSSDKISEGGIYQKQFTTHNVISIGIPVMNLYSPNEAVYRSDIESTFKMIKEVVLP